MLPCSLVAIQALPVVLKTDGKKFFRLTSSLVFIFYIIHILTNGAAARAFPGRLNPKVHSLPFATAATSLALPGRPGLPSIGFKHCQKMLKTNGEKLD